MISQRILDEGNVAGYLVELGILESGDSVTVEPAGDGNINWVRRVRSSKRRSWIVKQARGALERFPDYRADTARLIYEARYLEVARPYDVDGVLPDVHHFDERHRVLVLQDIGEVPRMGEQLLVGADLGGHLDQLARFLARVHGATVTTDLAPSFRNDQMRRLHGDHIFALPFRSNDFDLARPVAERAAAMWSDGELVGRADRAYRQYLEPRGALVHADVQSSNVLITDTAPILLDAEIAHIGDPAFDVGTLVAHLYLPAVVRDEVDRARILARGVFESYRGEGEVAEGFERDVETYAAIEMIRRTIGAARMAEMEASEAALSCLDLAEAVLGGGEGLFD